MVFNESSFLRMSGSTAVSSYVLSTCSTVIVSHSRYLWYALHISSVGLVARWCGTAYVSKYAIEQLVFYGRFSYGFYVRRWHQRACKVLICYKYEDLGFPTGSTDNRHTLHDNSYSKPEFEPWKITAILAVQK